MGARGPAGKHPDARHGHRTAAENDHATFVGNPDLVWPPANGSWHPVAKRMWRAVKVSGQVAEWQQTDVEVAYLVCEQIHREFRYRHAMSAVGFQAVMGGINDLLMTVGSRRRAKLELARGESEQEAAASSAVTSLSSRRKAGA